MNPWTGAALVVGSLIGAVGTLAALNGTLDACSKCLGEKLTAIKATPTPFEVEVLLMPDEHRSLVAAFDAAEIPYYADGDLVCLTITANSGESAARVCSWLVATAVAHPVHPDSLIVTEAP